MRHAGATRYFAFYGVHSGIGTGLSTFWIFFLVFVFLGRFFLFLSECLFVPIRASQKRARTSITCIHHHHYHHHTGKGLGWGGEGWSNLCLFLVIWGKYRGTFSPPPSRAGFLYSSLVVVFLQPTIPKPPCSISCQRDPHPRAPEAPGSLSHPPSSLLVKHAAGHAGTKGEERVVFSSEWFGRDGGVERGQGCVSMGLWEGGTSLQEKGNLPLPSQDKTFCRNFNVGMGVGGGGGGDWHGQAGRGATCMDLESREEVRDAYLRRTRSISPTGFVSLCLSLARRGWGERRDNPGSSQGKKETEGNRKAQHHHSQQIERARGNSPLSNALRRGGFLYSHYFLFPSGIIIQNIFFHPPSPMITRVVSPP